jgi:5'-nucleotidase
MHLLISNDDGLDAPGLAALYRAVRPLGDVSVVVPARERSSCSHAVSLRSPITVHETQHPVFGRAFAVEGTPADCIRIAVGGLLDQPIDWVCCGINEGANLGVDTFYSGTVAGAREAGILGLAAVAISQYVQRPHPVDWEAATQLTRGLFEQVLALGRLQPAFWNVNLPALEAGQQPTAVRTVPASTDPMPMQFDRTDTPNGSSRQYVYSGRYADRHAAPDTDLAAVFAGDVSITPISLPSTDLTKLGISFHCPPIE